MVVYGESVVCTLFRIGQTRLMEYSVHKCPNSGWKFPANRFPLDTRALYGRLEDIPDVLPLALRIVVAFRHTGPMSGNPLAAWGGVFLVLSASRVRHPFRNFFGQGDMAAPSLNASPPDG